jgi:hypothetical protein
MRSLRFAIAYYMGRNPDLIQPPKLYAELEVSTIGPRTLAYIRIRKTLTPRVNQITIYNLCLEEINILIYARKLHANNGWRERDVDEEHFTLITVANSYVSSMIWDNRQLR